MAVEQGGIPADPRSTRPGCESQYHSTLISLTALTEAVLP